jgi:flagellar basal body-associated protein FliL
MKKYVWIPLVVLILLLLAGMVWLGYSFYKEREENKAMQELAALDKQEMENEYERFAL